MYPIEEYRKLVERDAGEISFLWKCMQILFCFLATASGYICSILFYIFWQDVFGGNCPLWAKLDVLSKMTVDAEAYARENADVSVKSDHPDWRKFVIVNYEYEARCEFFHAISLCSCAFGVMWLTLFFICGKGGYDARILSAPWRIVIPALSFNAMFVMCMMYTMYDVTKGYSKFITDLEQLFFEISSAHKFDAESRCEIIQDYVAMYNYREYDVCAMFLALQIFSWIMGWSWVGGLMVLILRIVCVVDFRLLKVTIYELADNTLRDLKDTDADRTEKQNFEKSKDD